MLELLAVLMLCIAGGVVYYVIRLELSPETRCQRAMDKRKELEKKLAILKQDVLHMEEDIAQLKTKEVLPTP